MDGERMRGAVHGATLHGGKAHLVRVETLLGRGLPRTILVGMPDQVAREARERLPAALQTHDFRFPDGKLLFNLVPAQLPKTGMPLDAALAMALLIADRQVAAPQRDLLVLAELDLAGRLTPPARGILLAAMAAARSARCRDLLTAPEAAAEAALAPGIRAWGLRDLSELGAWLESPRRFEPAVPPPSGEGQAQVLRLDAVRGQADARQAAVLAAVGRHPLWLQGPPGTGKSLLARRVVHLLPPPDETRRLALAQVEAAHGRLRALPRAAPMRAPHPTTSAQSLLGGGQPLRPGELSRAHGGVLFLDELPEFARPVLEGLRQPLEEREVRIQRARESAVFPADALLVATSNPCPCGNLTHPRLPCRCTPARLHAYRARLSGPLLDRFDLFVEMGPVPPEVVDGPPTPPEDEQVHARLRAARTYQETVATERGFQVAGDAPLDALQRLPADDGTRRLLHQAAEEMQLSGRGLLRCMRVARSAADLDARETLSREDVLLALSLRPPSAAAGTTTTRSPAPRPAMNLRTAGRAARSRRHS